MYAPSLYMPLVLPYSRKFSRDPIFADGRPAKISQSNFRGWAFMQETALSTISVWLQTMWLCHGHSRTRQKRQQSIVLSVVPAQASRTTEAMIHCRLADNQQTREARGSIEAVSTHRDDYAPCQSRMCS